MSKKKIQQISEAKALAKKMLEETILEVAENTQPCAASFLGALIDMSAMTLAMAKRVARTMPGKSWDDAEELVVSSVLRGSLRAEEEFDATELEMLDGLDEDGEPVFDPERLSQ